MFVVAPEVAVEHAVYDKVTGGTIKGADDLDALTKQIYSRYSIWPERHDQLKMQWMEISLMYEDAFYDINYVYGVVLALKFYEMYTRDPQHFVPRYIDLMQNGFDAPPATLLKRFLNIDLNDPRLVSDVLTVLEDKVNLLEQIARHADLYKRYQRLRAEQVKKITGSKEVNLWDMSVRAPGMQPPRYNIAEASWIIRAALAPLGTEYGTELAALLDPMNGRMDIVPGGHRKRGGFSKGFIGTDSIFFSSGFTGYYNDVRILTHESTHAVHRQLMNRNHVMPAYAEGPHYLFEAFAIFSESPTSTANSSNMAPNRMFTK